MFRLIALFTAGCFVIASPTALALPLSSDAASPVSTASPTTEIRVLGSGSGVDEEGRRLSYEIWTEDDVIYGDARIDEPDGDYVDIWREGDIIFYSGKFDGKPAAGEVPVDIDAASDAEPVCLGWIALVCIGAAILAGGCASFDGCVPVPETTVPGGGGGGDDGEDQPPGDNGGGDAE